MKGQFNAKAPRHLSREGRRLWVSIAADVELDSGSAAVLTLLAEAFDRRQQAREAILKDGATYRDRWNQLKSSPWVSIERDAALAMLRCYHTLGLDLQASEDNR